MNMKIEHFALPAKDAKKLAEWYRDNLGFNILYKSEGTPPIYFINLGEMSIEIVPPGKDDTVHNAFATHFAIVVAPEAFDRTIEDLQKKGIVFDPETNNAFFGGTRMRFTQDPEGHRLQIISRGKPLLS
ncbi:MAG: VOC family protein [Synergistaceae bacterium]|jgi:catechol 2,3-dioxygenase-like lactoylglutathione lyase family enzyme|nr:VOC family protein [Synergistaceae bacterium]